MPRPCLIPTRLPQTKWLLRLSVLLAWLPCGPGLMAADLSAEVRTALQKGVAFFYAKAASHGGYVYRYSADFSLREAEGIPDADTIWIQPPGTPAVGLAMLAAHQCSGDALALKASVEAAQALARTQLASGGWDYSGHFSAALRSKKQYRLSAEGKALPIPRSEDGESGWHVWRRQDKANASTFDDDVSQAATRLLLRVDQVLEGKQAEIHQAAEAALQAILLTQYPNGGWSANFDAMPAAAPPASRYPLLPASFPAAWSRTWTKDFSGCYVLNDNSHATLMATLLLAWQLRGDERCLAAAKRAGDFLKRAQLPSPQPAWAQQYDAAMQPVWSRAFEPPAITGRESQSAMWALLRLASQCGDRGYLEPLRSAMPYLRRITLPSGKLARFYELQSNRPLFFERGKGGKGFVLTDSDKRASSNYGWYWDSELDAMADAMRRIEQGQAISLPLCPEESQAAAPDEAEVRQILAAQDGQGAWAATDEQRGWIRDGQGKKTRPKGGVIHSEDFNRNILRLCQYLNASSRRQ